MIDRQENGVLQRLSRDNTVRRTPTWLLFAVLAPILALTQCYLLFQGSHGNLLLIGAACGVTAAGWAAFFGVLALVSWFRRRVSSPAPAPVTPPTLGSRLITIAWLAFVVLQGAPSVMTALRTGDWSPVSSGLLLMGGFIAALFALDFGVALVRKLDGSKFSTPHSGKPLDLSSL